MLLGRFHVFLLTLMIVTTIYHLFKDSPTIVTQPLVIPPLKEVAPLKPLHVIVGPPTRYEHDLTALYAFAPIPNAGGRVYRRRSSSRSL